MKLILVYTLIILACNSNKQVEATVTSMPGKEQQNPFPFDMSYIDEVWIMDNELIEISGLTCRVSDGSIWTINDELGLAYQLDSMGRIHNRLKFGPHADYEGIEWANNELYIVKSNGNLFKPSKNGDKSEVFKTTLSMANDVEGLAYDSRLNQLILACKASPAITEHPKKKDKKAFYTFDLAENALMEEAYFEITDQALIDYFKNQNAESSINKIVSKKLQERLKSFSPSAIAVHPADNNYYILSAVGKLLVVFNPAKGIQHIELLDMNVHYQPEGICFDTHDRLYIANEGKGLKAKVYIYKSRLKS